MWPSPLSGTSSLVSWLNRLLKSCRRNEIKPGLGYRVRQSDTGTVLEIASVESGSLVYVRACLSDGTECYVPIKTYGTIYRTKGATPATPTIDAGATPDSSPTLD